MANLEGIGLALQGFGEGFQGRGAQFSRGLQERETQKRQQAESARQRFIRGVGGATQMIRGGDLMGAVRLLDSIDDPNAQRAARELLAPQTSEETALDLFNLESRAITLGDLQGPETVSAKEQAETERIQLQSEGLRRGLDQKPKDTTRADQARAAKIEAETKKLIAETEKIRRLAKAPIAERKLNEDEKATVKINAKRIGELSQNQRSRELSIIKAKGFLKSLKSGEASSGTTRTALSFIPGSFTKQSEFDQKFNAFAEVAARQKLKASGELRPTDQDVEGMKRAIFGVGRDEAVNIDLLSEFILEQEASNDELLALNKARRQGNIASFSGGQELTKQRLVFNPQTGQLEPK